MGWSLGWDQRWNRDVGYGVPAYCDHPDCNEEIDRGLSYVCGGEPFGGEDGCGLYFCEKHRQSVELFIDAEGNDQWGDDAPKEHEDGEVIELCSRCAARDSDGERAPPFDPKPEHPRWLKHMLTDASWEVWRAENPRKVEQMRVQQLLRLEAAKGDLTAAMKAEQDLMTRMESAA